MSALSRLLPRLLQRVPRLAQRVARPARAPFAALALTALLSFGASRPIAISTAAPAATTASLASSASTPALSAPLGVATCPRGTLPDGDVCVHLPETDDDGQPEAESSTNAHHDRMGRWVVYDEIPRRPDRPADYDAYRYPIPCGPAAQPPPTPAGVSTQTAHATTATTAPTTSACVVSGYDLDRADERQRRGQRLRQVGHGAVDLLAPRGTPITSIALEHQQGDAEVLYVGPLFGTTVVTRHTLREGGRLRDYVLLFGHLDGPAPGLVKGATLRDGDLVGFVGDTGSPDVVHLHLEARRLRDGIDPARLTAGALVDGANTVVCDPRNVLPIR